MTQEEGANYEVLNTNTALKVWKYQENWEHIFGYVKYTNKEHWRRWEARRILVDVQIEIKTCFINTKLCI